MATMAVQQARPYHAEFTRLPCGFTEADDDHYAHHIGNTLMYLLSDEHTLQIFTDHCHLDGRPHVGNDYCGIYEREVDIRLESALDTLDLDDCDVDSCDELEYDLESLEQYSPVYDRTINTWSSFIMTDIDSVSELDTLEFDFESLRDSNSTLNDILNDNSPESRQSESMSEGSTDSTSTNDSTVNEIYKKSLQTDGDTGSQSFYEETLCNNRHVYTQVTRPDQNDNLDTGTHQLPSSKCALGIISITDNATAMAKLVS